MLVKPLPILIEIRAVQPSKAFCPMLVMPLPRVTEVSAVHPLNTFCSIVVTLSGMISVVKEEQFWNAY